MKIVVFAFIILIVVSSCTKSYTCGRQCHVFNGGAIEICQTTAVEATQFYKSSDSLVTIYGGYKVVFADSVYVGGYSNDAENSVVNQLEAQGYTCGANAY